MKQAFLRPILFRVLAIAAILLPSAAAFAKNRVNNQAPDQVYFYGSLQPHSIAYKETLHPDKTFSLAFCSDRSEPASCQPVPGAQNLTNATVQKALLAIQRVQKASLLDGALLMTAAALSFPGPVAPVSGEYGLDEFKNSERLSISRDVLQWSVDYAKTGFMPAGGDTANDLRDSSKDLPPLLSNVQ